MLKLSQILILVFLTATVSAKDIIYTISGEIDQQKTSLDSILVESLSNNRRILFDNLPEVEYNQMLLFYP